MATVTQRVKQVRQPRGGYINPRSMEVRQLNDGNPSPLDHTAENIHPSLVGMAVDYLARFFVGTPAKKAFSVSLMGATVLRKRWRASRLLKRVVGLDHRSITSACQLVGFDVGYRTGGAGYRPVARIKPDTATIDHIRIMVQRSLAFFDQYGPITLNGFRFPGAYTKLVTNGDGDFLTADTLWDFKVSVRPPTKDHTLQLLMYWIMGRCSGQPEFRSMLGAAGVQVDHPPGHLQPPAQHRLPHRPGRRAQGGHHAGQPRGDRLLSATGCLPLSRP